MAFMQPMAEYLSRAEAREYTGDKEATKGWYSRLSAPGYMDCTEWQGPYADEGEALAGVCDTYDICLVCAEDFDVCTCNGEV